MVSQSHRIKTSYYSIYDFHNRDTILLELGGTMSTSQVSLELNHPETNPQHISDTYIIYILKN